MLKLANMQGLTYILFMLYLNYKSLIIKKFMGRYKKDNPKDQTILVRMDRRLRNQLERQARGNNMTIAKVARMAIRKFILEEANK